MAITYVNRKGKTYYLHQGVTKKGNPKYYFSQKSEGNLVDSIPEGYEIYENPNAQVFLRRIPPKIITDAEVDIVQRGIDKYSEVKYYQIDVEKNIIVVYLPDQNVDFLSEISESAPGIKGMNLEEIIDTFVSYSPMMRFVLVDTKHRQFEVERSYFMSSTDDWILISDVDELSTLVKEYVPHLGQDSFFELFY